MMKTYTNWYKSGVNKKTSSQTYTSLTVTYLKRGESCLNTREAVPQQCASSPERQEIAMKRRIFDVVMIPQQWHRLSGNTSIGFTASNNKAHVLKATA
jgi:hypothetical protein